MSLLGDRAFSSYGHVALLVAARSLHGIFRAHQKLIVDFTPDRPHVDSRQRTSSGCQHGQAAIEMDREPRARWIRSWSGFAPVEVPAWLTAEAWAALPATLRVRELRYTIARPGFRVRTVTLVTTLLDPVRYPKEKLAEAYGLRWTIETGLRPSQDDDEDGRAAVPDRPRHRERADDVPAGL